MILELKHTKGIYSLPKIKPIKGVFGHYYRIEKNIGIKIIKYYKDEIGNFAYSYPELLKVAKLEAKYLKLAETINLGPKFYGLKKFEINGKLYPAIIMEHIIGKHYVKRINDSFSVMLIKKLESIGLRHGDIHSKNIIFKSNGNFKVIDFGPNGIIEIIKPKNIRPPKVIKRIEA